MSEAVRRGITGRFGAVAAKQAASREPTARADVASARERIGADLAFIGYVEGPQLAAMGDGHAEDGAKAEAAHTE